MSEQARARTAVARLEMVSHGSTRNYDGDGRGGGDTSPRSGWDSRDDGHAEYISHLGCQRLLLVCRHETDFARVADLAERALRNWQITRPPPRDSEAWRDKIATDTRKTRFVADEYKISRSYVRQLRAAKRGESP